MLQKKKALFKFFCFQICFGWKREERINNHICILTINKKSFPITLLFPLAIEMQMRKYMDE
jgi:hypothetical protein